MRSNVETKDNAFPWGLAVKVVVMLGALAFVIYAMKWLNS